MIGNRVLQAEFAEPPIGQVERDVLAEPAGMDGLVDDDFGSQAGFEAIGPYRSS